MEAAPLKNMLLAFPQDWFIDPATLDAAKADLPSMGAFYSDQGLEDPKASALRAIISEPLREVYTVPLFSEKYCSLLLDEVKNHQFIPNAEEDEARQMPELVLHEKLPLVYAALHQIVGSVMNPIFFAIWQQVVTVARIQVANYNPKDKAQGAWHHDESSDITVVVPLNTGEYVGGGTDFFGRGTLDPLPIGTAAIFPGLTHLHRGRLVQEGDRFLLVFWLKIHRGIA